MTRARDNAFNPFNNNYAGKNVLINGAMDIWQRGTSFPATGPGAVIYSADRWTCYAGNTGTISRDSSFAPVGFENSLKFTSTINNSGIDFYQLIETKNVIPLQGKTVTLSAYVAGTNGKTSPGMTAYYSTTTDDMIYLTSGVLMQVAAVPAALSSTSFQRMSMTFTVPSTAKTIRIGLISNVLNNTEFINWTGVQLEVGSIPTPFSRSSSTVGGELDLCQRYYWQTDSASSYFYSGFSYSSTIFFSQIPHPVTMRTPPTFIPTGSAGDYRILQGGSFLSTSPPTQETSLRNVSTLRYTGSGYTVGYGGAGSGSNANSFLAFSAEL
jgi:hypothetical protein